MPRHCASAPQRPSRRSRPRRTSRFSTFVAALSAATLLGSSLQAQPYAGPERLEATLAWLRMTERQGGYTQVPPGDTLEEGMQDARVLTLCMRLRESRDMRASCSDVFDASLTEAVRGLQQRHGLEPDGRVGPMTLAEINVPIGERIAQIEQNIELQREFLARWEREGERYVFVNVPDFRLFLMHGHAQELEMRVVVGQQGWQTPVIHERMEYLVLNPDWTVPPNIARREIAPGALDDPRYLERRGLQVYKGGKRVAASAVDWEEVAAGKASYRIVQPPGDNNPLGQVKFMFPNPEAIYLHDTPHDHLFERTRRALSHGCIRVEHPLELAAAILRHQPGWDRERLEAVTAGNESQRVDLDEPMLVHIVYWTAFVDTQGVLHFRADPWGTDIEALRANAIIDEALQPDLVPVGREPPDDDDGAARPWWEWLPL